MSYSRKEIEDYYKNEWVSKVSSDTLNLLIELTCKEFNLNKQGFTPNKEKDSSRPKPLDLGEI